MIPSGVDTLDLYHQSTTTLIVTLTRRETHLTMMLVTAVRNNVDYGMSPCNLPCMMSLGSASPLIGNFTSSFNTAPQLTSLGGMEGEREGEERDREVVNRLLWLHRPAVI